MAHIKDMHIGEEAEIIGFDAASKEYRSKLLSMGLTKGTTIKLTKIAPMGDPVEIKVRGFSLSLRRDEANVLSIARRI